MRRPASQREDEFCSGSVCFIIASANAFNDTAFDYAFMLKQWALEK